jgi:hypothetical protein
MRRLSSVLILVGLPGGAAAADPITHAASAWAVLGLVRSSPDVARPGNTPVK